MTSSIPPLAPSAQGRPEAWGSPSTLALRELLDTYDDLQRHVALEMHLGLNDVTALEHLVRRSDIGPAGLASLLGITTASATVLVDRLEKAGHVERRSHPEDRRRKQLVVTESAKVEVFTALRPIFEMHREIDALFNDEEQAVIQSYLQQVAQRYRSHVHGETSGTAPEGRGEG